jgi:predicted HNH restriction endonuclease
LSGRFKKTERERCNNDMSNLITLCNSCHQSLHNEIEYTLVKRHLDETIEITNKFLGE